MQQFRFFPKRRADIWTYIKWEKDEVGSSKIGFFDLDFNVVKPEYIARFINSKAEKIIGD